MFSQWKRGGGEKEMRVVWAVGRFGVNGPLRQYFSPYRAVFQRRGERREKWETGEKLPNNPPNAPTASAVGPCHTIIQISWTPRHWKFTQHHRTTRPPQRDERKHFQTTPYVPNASRVGPCATIMQISRTPRHLKLLSTIARPQPPLLRYQLFEIIGVKM